MVDRRAHASNFDRCEVGSGHASCPAQSVAQLRPPRWALCAAQPRALDNVDAVIVSAPTHHGWNSDARGIMGTSPAFSQRRRVANFSLDREALVLHRRRYLAHTTPARRRNHPIPLSMNTRKPTENPHARSIVGRQPCQVRNN